MQDDLQRLELETKGAEKSNTSVVAYRCEPPSSSTRSRANQVAHLPSSKPNPAAAADHRAYQNNDSRSRRLDGMDRDAPSFSPFPKVTGDNVPPPDDAKEEILWTARKHVLHSQNVSMQISWARDVLTWVDIAADAAAREPSDKARPATPRIEHELREDAMNIINYLSRQAHPDALYIQAKWLEFGKFDHRIDKREAYSGYKRAAELGHARSEYRLGMLFEQSNDMFKAKEHYYKGMSLKDSAALYRMGMMSLLGQHGETKDYPRGLERIQAAADSADEDAPQGSYVYGMLVGRDLPDITIPDGLLLFSLETAQMFVEKAAYLGFAKAQLKMGQAYELCQLGCEFNPSYSLHYYGLAAKQGLPEAALGVSRWFLFGYEGVFKKNEELAYKYAREAAVAKLPTGEFALGYYYEIGIHVNKSIPDARKWYQQAADHGNKDAVGRLESLNQDKSLSKKDHETTTLTRIKSQHGSQRGKRPERFKQPQQMPTLSEGSGPLPGMSSLTSDSPRVSPHPSPGFRPTIVSESMSFPDPSRASVVGSDRQPAFSLRLDTDGAQPPRPHSAAPYPDDDRSTLTVNRSRSMASYPEDDGRGGHNTHQTQGLYSPHADRPISSLQPQPSPQPGGRVVSAGYGSPAGYRQPSPGPGNAPGRLYPGDDFQGRLASAQPYPNNNASANQLQEQPLRQQHDMAPYHDPRALSQNYERFSRVPGAAGRTERLGSLRLQDPQRLTRVSSGLGQGPPGSPRPGVGRIVKGPATFEDMGIPQGKQEGDCVIM
ncbi:hypothetical protein G6O67_001338 [Ophiocordyceps sinensis]|uniref:Tetratricopeptide-like helical n=1 Tax=Ophiocordyceps sinensis TaxID=72228 RepID=A0A8H4V8U3_9HYPO|nr:hypothetical protein G6O67_001338 [Ophiocordyceps sinensis]